ncbi:MAG: hypothetical protein AB7T49_14855 [Oligoflexales bacterium]
MKVGWLSAFIFLFLAEVAQADEPSASHIPLSNHQVGIELGGSSFMQLRYHYRVFGPAYVAVGGLMAPHAANGSLGTSIVIYNAAKYSIASAFGIGSMALFGESSSSSACEDGENCEAERDDDSDKFPDSMTYGYGQIAAFYKLLRNSHLTHEVGGSVGYWNGAKEMDDNTKESFQMPVIGVSYLVSFGRST